MVDNTSGSRAAGTAHLIWRGKKLKYKIFKKGREIQKTI